MDENNSYETQKEQDYEFTEKEHNAGFHDKVQEGCYECHKENRLMKAHKVVNSPIDSLAAITGIKLSDMLGK